MLQSACFSTIEIKWIRWNYKWSCRLIVWYFMKSLDVWDKLLLSLLSLWQVPTNSNSPNTHSKSFPHWPLFSLSPMPHGSPSCWYDLIDRSVFKNYILDHNLERQMIFRYVNKLHYLYIITFTRSAWFTAGVFYVSIVGRTIRIFP